MAVLAGRSAVSLGEDFFVFFFCQAGIGKINEKFRTGMETQYAEMETENGNKREKRHGKETYKVAERLMNREKERNGNMRKIRILLCLILLLFLRQKKGEE